MQHKIGEIVTLPNGMKAKVVEGDACDKCALYKDDCSCFTCTYNLRLDCTNIIYKEIEEE